MNTQQKHTQADEGQRHLWAGLPGRREAMDEEAGVENGNPFSVEPLRKQRKLAMQKMRKLAHRLLIF